MWIELFWVVFLRSWGLFFSLLKKICLVRLLLFLFSMLFFLFIWIWCVIWWWWKVCWCWWNRLCLNFLSIVCWLVWLLSSKVSCCGLFSCILWLFLVVYGCIDWVGYDKYDWFDVIVFDDLVFVFDLCWFGVFCWLGSRVYFWLNFG